MAKEAAGAAAEGIATGSNALLGSLRQRERELDTLDLEIDNGVTSAITEVGPAEARELLACMKFMIGLERIGDLLLSFANSAQSVSGRIDSEDTRDLTQMATLLEKMLTDCGDAFSERNVGKAIEVLRADAEMDRLRNLIFLRHIENPENVHRAGEPAGDLYDAIAGARRRSRQEPRRGSLPFRERPPSPSRADCL